MMKAKESVGFLLFYFVLVVQIKAWSVALPYKTNLPQECSKPLTPQRTVVNPFKSSEDILSRFKRHLQRQNMLSDFRRRILNRYADMIMGFANQLLPDFESVIQESLFRFYVQFYFGSHQKPSKGSKQRYITEAIKGYNEYRHLLPYKEYFRGYDIKISPQPVKILRTLSFVEAPLRGCLGNDCSSTVYLDTAFHPSYYYFTLTDSQGHSNGHITLVLGAAKHQATNLDISVAFVDKIQNVSEADLPFMLTAIRESVLERGYVLIVPDNLGGHTGLSIDDDIRFFIQNNVSLNKAHPLVDFSPQIYSPSLKLPRSTGYSRADQGLLSFAVQSTHLDLEAIYKHGEIKRARTISSSMDRSLFFFDLLLFLSDEDDPQTAFLLADLLLHLPDEMKRIPVFESLMMRVLRQIEAQSMPYIFKAAMRTLDMRTLNWIVHDIGVDIDHIFEPLRTTVFHIFLAMDLSKESKIKLLTYLVNLGADINATNGEGHTPLYIALKEKMDRDIIALLLDLGADVDVGHISDLTIMDPEIIELFLSRGITLNQ